MTAEDLDVQLSSGLKGTVMKVSFNSHEMNSVRSNGQIDTWIEPEI